MIELTTTLYIVSVLLCSSNEYCTIQYILSYEVLHVPPNTTIVGCPVFVINTKPTEILCLNDHIIHNGIT